MDRFIVEDNFWEVFPEAKLGVVICRGINNKYRSEEIYFKILSDAQIKAKMHLNEEDFTSNKVVKVWREAFKKFKTKKGARSSIEALLKRVNNNHSIGNINPLVDIYNAVSLEYAFPCGGEDMDSVKGDLKLTKAIGGESFLVLGSDDNSPALENEIVYKDDIGAVCRCWNWRESKRTMLTEDTNNAFMCIEHIDSSRDGEFEAALESLRSNIEIHLGGICEIYVLDSQNRKIEINVA
ncbi:MAG: B3/4 domain-containing protein [Clostridiales bacterium]|nr:B3/4 domain-containing protein [Clostridiales bacterium]